LPGEIRASLGLGLRANQSVADDQAGGISRMSDRHASGDRRSGILQQ